MNPYAQSRMSRAKQVQEPDSSRKPGDFPLTHPGSHWSFRPTNETMSLLKAALALFAPAIVVSMSIVPQEPTPDRGSDEPKELIRAQGRLAAMDWLAGHWIGEMWGGTFYAHYSTPEGGLILSHSRLIKEGDEAFYEFEVFGPADDEVVWLQPYPSGRKAVGLRLRELDVQARKATFENPEKDYPTRIVYHRKAEDELVITLSDPHGGSEKLERFELRRP